VIEVNEGVCWPEFVAQLFSSNHFSRPFKQRRQHLKWLLLELYPLTALAQFPGVEIDLERAETNDS